MESKETRYQSAPTLQEDGSIAIRELIDYFWRMRGWIIFTVVVSLFLAFVYLKIQPPVYSRTTWIKLNGNETSINAELSLLPGLSDLSGNKRLDNEVFILQSPSLMNQVVEALGLNTRYYKICYGIKRHEYYKDSPFSMTCSWDAAPRDSSGLSSVQIEFRHNEAGGFKLIRLLVDGARVPVADTPYSYGTPIALEGASIVIGNDRPGEMTPGARYVASWSTPYATARNFVGKLNVSVQGKGSNRTDVVLVSITDSSPVRAADILDNLVAISNQQARKYKAQTSLNIIEFIDSRLREISDQLNDAEAGYKDYQSSRALVNSDSQTTLAITSDMSYRDQLTGIRLQLQILRMITSFMDETPEGEYRVVPSNIGVVDSGLNSMIGNYNDKIIERNRMVANSSEANPKVVTVNTELEVGRKSIELSLANLIKVYSLRERELERILKDSRSQIEAIPQQQLEMQQLSRKLEVIEPLYLLLRQKREEYQITMFGEEDTFRVIEKAFGPNAPVGPNGMMVYLLALMFGVFIGPCVERLRAFIRSKVETKLDVETAVDAPILAVLPASRKKDYRLIPRSGHDSLCESFQMLRSTVQSFPDAKVFQVTSSVLGEGKSFVAANLALSLAYVGKKVVLVGMDLRKPALSRIFKFEADKDKSLFAYLDGKTSCIDDIIFPCALSDNLDLIPAGAVAPNPNELLSGERHVDLISELKKRYSYVILDCTPYFPVADASIINKSVDATLFVVRCDYTTLKLLREIDAAAHSRVNPIKNLNIIINGFDKNARKYRYGYGEGYGTGTLGYGYGYGYGYEK